MVWCRQARLIPYYGTQHRKYFRASLVSLAFIIIIIRTPRRRIGGLQMRGQLRVRGTLTKIFARPDHPSELCGGRPVKLCATATVVASGRHIPQRLASTSLSLLLLAVALKRDSIRPTNFVLLRRICDTKLAAVATTTWATITVSLQASQRAHYQSWGKLLIQYWAPSGCLTTVFSIALASPNRSQFWSGAE